MDGIQRTMTGGACNTPIPALANQTNFITEKNSLPIVKVLYGPLVHEAQSAKIIIGPLICDPKPLNDWSKFNLETNVKNLAQKIEISINDTKSSLDEEKVNLETRVKSLARKIDSHEIRINDTKTSLNEEKVNLENSCQMEIILFINNSI